MLLWKRRRHSYRWLPHNSRICYHPTFKIAQFLSLPSRKGWNSSISVLKIMSSKNACALEFACILWRNIECSIIIIIIIIILLLNLIGNIECSVIIIIIILYYIIIKTNLQYWMITYYYYYYYYFYIIKTK